MRGGAALLVAMMGLAPAAAETVDGRSVVIIDGDTIALGRERIRILNIDAPESFRSRCEAELAAGLRAKARLADLLRAGGISIERHGHDRYGRTLARIGTASGLDAGEVLVAEGLALPWTAGAVAWQHRYDHWCH